MVVGDVEITPILDAVGIIGKLEELYPNVPADAWDPSRELYPELFAEGAWRLRCTCYLLRAGATTVMVDTGVGPSGSWDWGAEREEGLPEGLERLDVDPGDVDLVFFTHLHIDHLGWNVDRDGSLLFPNARHVVHRDALAYALERTELPHIRRCIVPLANRFERLDGPTELAPGLTAFPLPGHYPGHMGIRMGGEAVLIADAAVHPALLEHLDWPYVSDIDQETCAATRRALLPELVDTGVLAICGHYPGSGIGRIIRRGGRIVWEEAP